MLSCRHSAPDIGRVILDLYREAQEAGADSFPQEAFKRLEKFIRFDSCGISTFCLMAQGRHSLISQFSISVAVGEHAALRDEFVDVPQVVGNDGLLSRDPVFSKAVGHVGKSHRLEWEEIPDGPLREYAKRWEGVNAMAMVTSAPGQTVTSFSLWRAHVGNSFSAGDEALADVLLPHITQAISINRKIAVTALTGGSKQTCSLIADHQGLIHHIDDLALSLLRREYPGWLSAHLPQDLLDSLASSSTQRHVGRLVIITLRRQGTILVCAIQSRIAGEKLTPAEMCVVSTVVKHDSYKEAARRLGVSPATIRNHLHAIYGKLNIRSKSDLAKAFRDYD